MPLGLDKTMSYCYASYMTGQGKRENDVGPTFGAGVVPASMALAGLEVHNAGALPFVGRAGENKMTIKTKPQTHTPGPWTQCTGYVINGSLRVPVKIGSAPAITIAETIGPLKGQMCYADARLIAAAPELLEAAKALIKRLEDMTTEEYARSGEKVERDRLCATIAKAEGQEVR